MDCWKKAQNQLNIIDLDVDLKLSNKDCYWNKSYVTKHSTVVKVIKLFLR